MKSPFTREHPYLCFAVGVFICGHKFPWDYWVQVASARRKKIMDEHDFGLTWDDPDEPYGSDADLIYCWDRVEGKAPDGDGKYGRLSHNLTDLTITYFTNRNLRSYTVKFLCALIVYGYEFFIAVILAMVLI